MLSPILQIKSKNFLNLRFLGEKRSKDYVNYAIARGTVAEKKMEEALGAPKSLAGGPKMPWLEAK